MRIDVAKLRVKRVKYAVATSISSKITSAVLQILVMPIAAASLGVHGFALYALLVAAAGWLTLSSLGLGPAVVVDMAAARADANHVREAKIFTSALVPSVAISAAVGALALLLVWIFPVERIFGANYVHNLQEIRWGLTSLIGLFVAQTILSVFEATQSGFQEQFVLNIFSTVASLPCIAAVLFVAKYMPSPVSLILALNGPLVLFRAFNAGVVLRRNPHLIASGRGFDPKICRLLIKRGVAFSFAGGVGNFLAHIFPVILVGSMLSVSETASFAATMNLVVLASGVVGMLSTPLWPAIADSIAQGDIGWAEKAHQRLVLLVMSISFFFFAALAVFGQEIFDLWFGGRILPSAKLLAAAGIYFMASCWEIAYFSTLVGLNKMRTGAMLVFLRGLLGGIVMYLLLRGGAAAWAPFVSMVIAIALVDAIPMRKFVLRELSSR